MKSRLALLALPAVLAVAACAPPGTAHSLIQRTPCNTQAVVPQSDACTHWINHKASWNYPAETEWVGPYSDYEVDRDNYGGESLP